MKKQAMFAKGQMSLFDLMDTLLEESSEAFVNSPMKVVKENYLVKGEKILSLLREKTSEFKESSFLELFSQKAFENSDDRAEYIRKRIRQALIRPVIESGDDFDSETESAFRSLFCGYDRFSFKPADSYGKEVYRAVTRDPDSWVVGMSFDGVEQPYMFGRARVSAKKHGRLWHMRRVKNKNVVIMDFGTFFADMVFLCQVKNYLGSYFQAAENLEENVVYNRLKEMAQEELKSLKERWPNGLLPVREQIAENQWLKEVMESAGFQMAPVFRGGPRICISDLLANFLLSEKALKEDFQIFEDSRAIRLYANDMSRVLAILLDDYSEEKRAEEYRRNLSDTYAKSFMTKKNIPQKIVDAMEASGFNSFFGYVEFDEECDVKKLQDLYLEFQALVQYLHLKEHKNVALRFRKLGNHKASGLYYPMVRCLCVDVRTPSSFTHELFHMLDYEQGEVSRTWGFQKCKDLYKEEFDRLARKQGKKFTGKYDREYYFQSTEIFARCAEMYLTRICGIDNSLVMPELESVEYPWSDALAEEVSRFFNGFLFGKDESGCMLDLAG